MTTQTTDAIGAALDYVDAALTGPPTFAETVLDTYGVRLVSRGMGAILVFLIIDAAVKAECGPHEIVQRIRETYGGTE